MYVFKNALRNITRAKGRSMLIFTLILVISVSACVALSIRGSAQDAKEQAYSNMSITGSISVDRDSLMEDMRNGDGDRTQMMSLMQQNLSLEEMEQFADSEYVTDFYYTGAIGLSATEEFEAYASDEITAPIMPSDSQNGARNKFGDQNISSDFTVTGYSSHDGMSEFVSGVLTVLDGSVFDVEDSTNQVVISEEIAYLNELEVGSTFNLINPLQETEKITLTVAGIFECSSTDGYANNIYMSYASVQAISEASALVATEFTDERSGDLISTAINSIPVGTYVFTNSEDYQGFEAGLEDMGLDTQVYTLLSLDLEDFEASVVPLENLSNFTYLFFIVVLAIGGIILVLFNLFTVRERKYEIGVLAAIGMQKSKVAIQFITEVIIITFVAIVIGSGIGAVSSQPIADRLLASQIEAAETESSSVDDNFGGNFEGRGPGSATPTTPTTDVEYIDTMVAGMNANVFLQLMGIGMLLAIMASSVGLITILRYEPLKILTNRS